MLTITNTIRFVYFSTIVRFTDAYSCIKLYFKTLIKGWRFIKKIFCRGFFVCYIYEIIYLLTLIFTNMDQNKITMFLSSMSDKFPNDKIGVIQNQLEKIDDSKFLSVQTANYKNPVVLFILSFFFGSIGVDRFILGQTGLGVAKLLTCGGMGVWWLVDLILIMKNTKEYNFNLFAQIAN